MNANFKRVLSGLIGILSVMGTAGAMSVSPMHVEMVSAGKYSRAQVSVSNNSKDPLPVEAIIRRLTLDESGKQQISKAGEDFLVMPPQAIIPPGGRQNFRVQWLGDPLMRQSESFLLMINQVPVKLRSSHNGVQVVMGLGVMINVAPPKGAPELKVVATGITTDKSGRKVPAITVQNTSNMHALLPEAEISLSSGNWSQRLPANSLSNGIGVGLVQPGRKRKFALPVPLPAGVSSVKASVVMLQKR